MKPLTATMIIEANREYWRRKEPELHRVQTHLRELTERAFQAVDDILRGRVRYGWPTREDGGDIC
jgi:hypothetical protein